jgi:hypothetical protein
MILMASCLITTRPAAEKHMRLESLVYERAIRDAASFLGINADGCDADGNRWDFE